MGKVLVLVTTQIKRQRMNSELSDMQIDLVDQGHFKEVLSRKSL